MENESTVFHNTSYSLTSVSCDFSVAKDVIRWVICLLILISNSLTLTALSSSNMPFGIKGKLSITSLALSDLLIAPAIMIGGITRYSKVSCGFDITPRNINLRRWTAAFQGSIFSLSVGTSFWTLVVIACERLIALGRPLSYKVWVTQERLTLVLKGVWVYNVLSFASIFFSSVANSPYRKIAAAISSYDILPQGAVAVINGQILFCLSANIVLYISTSIILRKAAASCKLGQSSGQEKRFQRSFRYTRMSITVIVFLVVFWAPFFFVSSIFGPKRATTPRWVIDTAMPWAYNFMFTNNWVNPLLFCWQNSDYRAAYRQLIFRYLPCVKTAAKIHPELGLAKPDVKPIQADERRVAVATVSTGCNNQYLAHLPSSSQAKILPQN